MERYYPRAGLACTLLSLPMWLGFLLNGVLGFFPAILFADGGMGSKFHFWYFIQDRLLGGSSKPVWSEAGVMTSQEWAMLALALPLTVGALYCLRQRPEFGNIDSGDMAKQREDLEMASEAISTKGSGDENTAAIVDSVIGKKSVPDQTVVKAALGEMGVIAAANAVAAAEEMEESEEEDSIDPVHDSRFTTVVGNEDVMNIASAAADEAKSTPEIIPEEVDDDPFDGWPEISKKDSEPEIESVPKIEPVKPPEKSELPTMEDTKKSSLGSMSGIADKISAGSNKAAEVSVSAAKGVVSIASKVKEKIVHTVRKPRASVMPVRPEGLPEMAEWDAREETWTLFGRPIKVASQVEPEPEKPAWVNNENRVSEVVIEDEPEQEPLPLLSATAITVPSIEEEPKKKRSIPKIPKIF